MDLPQGYRIILYFILALPAACGAPQKAPEVSIISMCPVSLLLRIVAAGSLLLGFA
jgi:hypothetical protein